MKAVVAAFNQEKVLVGAFSVITNLRMELFEALQLPVPAAVPEGGSDGWARLVLAPRHRVLRLPDAGAEAGPQQLAGAGPHLPAPLQPRLGLGGCEVDLRQPLPHTQPRHRTLHLCCRLGVLLQGVPVPQTQPEPSTPSPDPAASCADAASPSSTASSPPSSAPSRFS